MNDTNSNAARKTLAELNAQKFQTVQRVYSVGKSGSTCSGTTGAKLHLIIEETYTRPEGSIGHSVESGCGNATGRRVAGFSKIDGLDTDAITCSRCAKRVAK